MQVLSNERLETSPALASRIRKKLIQTLEDVLEYTAHASSGETNDDATPATSTVPLHTGRRERLSPFPAEREVACTPGVADLQDRCLPFGSVNRLRALQRP